MLPAMRTLLTLLALSSLLALPACGKGNEKQKKLAALCTSATEMLEKDTGSADTDTFMQMLQNALSACSGACDEKDDPSCKKLDEHLTKLCSVSIDMCDSLCGSVKSPSLKKYSCAHGTKK